MSTAVDHAQSLAFPHLKAQVSTLLQFQALLPQCLLTHLLKTHPEDTSSISREGGMSGKTEVAGMAAKAGLDLDQLDILRLEKLDGSQLLLADSIFLQLLV